MIALKSKEQLQNALEYCQSLGLRTITFDEPSWDYGFTSFAIEPLTEDQRHLMRKFQCWKGNTKLKESSL